MFLHLICSRAESPIGDSRPVERAIEARNGSEDGQGSMVRCLHFAHTYIANRKFSNILIHHVMGILSLLLIIKSHDLKQFNVLPFQPKQFLQPYGQEPTQVKC